MKTHQITKKVNDLIEVANRAFNITLPPVKIEYNLRGRSAGQAKYSKAFFSAPECTIRFNLDMINGSGFDHILNETVPHELAHIICFYTGQDRGHGKMWKKVCMLLGGNGERCHKEEVIPARITEQFAYETTCGRVVTVGKIRHNKIQRGVSYSLKSGGYLKKDSWKPLTA